VFDTDFLIYARRRAAGGLHELMDCVLPTRDGRRGRLYVWRSPPAAGERFYDRICIRDAKHRRSKECVDGRCDRACRRSCSRAYLHHASASFFRRAFLLELRPACR